MGVGWIFLALLAFAPTAYTPLKAALLVVLLIGVGLRIAKTGHTGIHPVVLAHTVGFSAVGAAFVLLGSLKGNPGALEMAPVFVAWPVVYTALLGALTNRAHLRSTLRVLIGATVAIELYLYAFLLHRAGIVPFQPLGLGEEAASNLTEFTAYSVSSLIFLIPFLVAALVLWPRSSEFIVRRRWIWIAVALAAPLVILSGRKGLWLAVAASPVLAVVIRRWLRSGGWSLVSARRLVFTTAPLVLLALLASSLTVGIGPGDLWRSLLSGFDFTTGDAGLGRGLQFEALVNGWRESPIVGQGLGAVAPEVIRSVEQPWAYELSYVALLFTTGLVGLAVYGYGAFWIARQARRMVMEDWEYAPLALALLIGTAGMLIANGTNPYLSKFDMLWTLFLPIGFVNRWLLEREGADRNAQGDVPRPVSV